MLCQAMVDASEGCTESTPGCWRVYCTRGAAGCYHAGVSNTVLVNSDGVEGGRAACVGEWTNFSYVECDRDTGDAYGYDAAAICVKAP